MDTGLLSLRAMVLAPEISAFLDLKSKQKFDFANRNSCVSSTEPMEDKMVGADYADTSEETDMVSMEGLKPLQTGLSSLFDIDETAIWGWLEPGEFKLLNIAISPDQCQD